MGILVGNQRLRIEDNFQPGPGLLQRVQWLRRRKAPAGDTGAMGRMAMEKKKK